MDTEKLKLRKGLNVIITTPGRLLYHLKNTKGIDFTPLKTIIFDEADLLLNMGFERDIKECLREIIKKELPPDDERIKEENHNPTLGIVLCDDTDEDIAKYSVLNGNEQLFASKYKLYLPSEEELKAEIENQKTMFYIQH